MRIRCRATLVERARAARPNSVIDGSVTPHIAAICARLDGVPLAIELAAARARAMPLDALARGLDDTSGTHRMLETIRQFAVRILSLGEAYVGLMQGDPRFAVALFDAAVADGHTDVAFLVGTGTTGVFAWLGQESEAQRTAEWVHDLMRETSGTADTAAGATAAYLNNSRGVFGDIDDIPESVNSWGMVSNLYAEAAAQRAVYTGQMIWQQRALRLCRTP